MNKELEQKTMFIIFHHVKTSLYTSLVSSSPIAENRSELIFEFEIRLTEAYNNSIIPIVECQKKISSKLIMMNNTEAFIIYVLFDIIFRFVQIWYRLASTNTQHSHRHQFFI